MIIQEFLETIKSTENIFSGEHQGDISEFLLMKQNLLEREHWHIRLEHLKLAHEALNDIIDLDTEQDNSELLRKYNAMQHVLDGAILKHC